MMRNPERIEPVLKVIEAIWKDHPDLRLGQLISIIAVSDPWHVEDYELLKRAYSKFGYAYNRELPEYWIEPNAFEELLDDMKSGFNKDYDNGNINKGGSH